LRPENPMNHSNFFGVRMARGASHLVVPEPPKKDPPPAAVAPPKVRRRKASSPKKKKPDPAQSVAVAVKAAADSLQEDEQFSQFNLEAPPQPAPPINDPGHASACPSHETVSYFDTEEN
jgi:hypothetical protein